jgi:hypothetical protein
MLARAKQRAADRPSRQRHPSPILTTTWIKDRQDDAAGDLQFWRVQSNARQSY